MSDLRELHSFADVQSAAGGDALVLWAAADLAQGTRAFSVGAAVAVAAPGLSGRDRLAVAGPASDAAALVRAVLPQVGPTFRPVGDEELIRHLVTGVAELEFVAAFGWMQTEIATGSGGAASWLAASDHADIA